MNNLTYRTGDAGDAEIKLRGFVMNADRSPSGPSPSGLATSAAAPVIRLTNLCKVFGTKANSHLAVSDVSMDIHEGDFVSLVGPSGCGKTTILKILAGLYGVDDGMLSLRADFQSDMAKHHVGMVFQQPLLLKWRTILENVMLPADVLGLPRRPAQKRARYLLEMVGLSGSEAKYPYELSGGMQQRAAIARALLHDPKLLLMDEPFGALDALTRERINLEMLRIWHETGKTIIFVTHSIQEALFLGSKCAVLTSGPARMADFFAIPLPYPRALEVKTTEVFGELTKRTYQLLGMK
jgi:NitT/TauT family transport system ATP-binding protein